MNNDLTLSANLHHNKYFDRFDEEMMESLFGYANPEKTKPVKKRTSSMDSTPQLIQIIDAKKSQNLSILLRALNVTVEEVSEAILEGAFL